MTQQDDRVERALWTAVRILEERAELRRRMASETEAAGLEAVSQSFAAQASLAEEQANQDSIFPVAGPERARLHRMSRPCSCRCAPNGHDSGSIDALLWQRRPRHARRERDRGPRHRNASYRMPPAKPGRARRHSTTVPHGAQVVTSLRAQTRGAGDVTIVGVGASAGGLEAFSSLVRALPPSPVSHSSSSSIWPRNTKAPCRRSSRVTRPCQSFKSPTACEWNAITCT